MDLEDQLSDGTLGPGDRLPTEAQLAEQFGVNRHTVRRALAGLDERGLIRVEQGRGTFVQEPVLSYRIAERTRFTDNVAGQNRTPSRDVIEVRAIPAQGEPAKGLDMGPDGTLTRIVVAGHSDGQRISHSEHFFSSAQFPGIGDAVRAEKSVTAALRRLGVDDYRRKWTRITARMPTSREADLLGQPRTRPILVAESLNVDTHGHPIEYCLTRFSSDWVQIVFEP